MLKIITCFKWVVDEAYIRRTPAGELDFSSIDYKISEYDRNAIEEAVRLKEAAGGGTITAVTVGVPESAKGVKDALSRGTDNAFFISDPDFRNLEPFQTAEILGAVIKSRIEYDLIICGEGSGDLYAQQVGPRMAENLGVPYISFIQKLSVENGMITAERKRDDFTEIISAPLPALITVLPEINSPRIPGVRDTLMASKKPITIIGRADLDSFPAARLETIDTKAARIERTCVKFGAGDIDGFVERLQKTGVIG